MINLLLAEDHLLVRAALAHLINSFQGIHVVAEGAYGHEILDAARIHPVDVALIDAALLPVQDWDLIRQLKTMRPGINVLVTSSYRSDRYVDRLMEAGACGFVHKNAAVNELETAIRQAAANRRVLYPGIDISGLAATEQAPSSVPALTRRQQEILELIVEGCQSRAIAEQLDLSIKTVEAHRREIMRRVGKQNSAGLVKEAIRLGLVPFPT